MLTPWCCIQKVVGFLPSGTQAAAREVEIWVPILALAEHVYSVSVCRCCWVHADTIWLSLLLILQMKTQGSCHSTTARVGQSHSSPEPVLSSLRCPASLASFLTWEERALLPGHSGLMVL